MNLYQNIYDKCNFIYELHPDKFSRKELYYKQFKIVIFSYTKAAVGQYQLFKDLDAFEMRGITFTFHENGMIYGVFMLLPKFYNVNENADWNFDVLKEFEFLYANNKDDGSVIHFITFPNGDIISKTKNDIANYQAETATKIVNSDINKIKFLQFMFNNNYSPIFELVSTAESENRIVLKYDKEELILLRIRNNLTGDFIDIREYADFANECGFEINDFEHYTTLTEVVEAMKIAIDKEGCVSTLRTPEGKIILCKSKTPWYMNLHYFRMDFLKEKFRENVMISEYLKGNYDDIIAEVKSSLDDEADKETIDRIVEKFDSIIVKVDKKTKILFNATNNLCNLYVSEKHTRKSFATKYNKVKEFPFMVRLIKPDDTLEYNSEHIIDNIYAYIFKVTYGLHDAQKFLTEEI